MKRNIAIIIALVVIIFLLFRKTNNDYIIRKNVDINLGTNDFPIFNVGGLEYNGSYFISNIINSVVPKRNAVRWTSDANCGCDKKNVSLSTSNIDRIIASSKVVNCGPKRWIENTNRKRNGISAKKVFWNQCQDLEDERLYGKYAVN